ncbi:MAG: hypothetical protein OEM60_06095 [Gammaproteobacteria bacterium]|nr:hypothetical protein [Gammaproteobacteria bacterium]MDH3433408.1 hypothetical protein [Gammaproteobacteria bacterium]
MKFWPLLLLLPVALHAQDDMWDDDAWDDDDQKTVWSGYLEAALGTRFDHDPLIDERNTLEDLRWRVESEWQRGRARIGFKADAGYDGIEDDWDADIRDLTVAMSFGDNVDIKLGRQVQTWGTGDLVFLNDLFPKDFVSFFAGRHDEYLKAPGNAIRVTRFSPSVNVDFVWTPVFEPDVYLTGERFSFFSPLAGTNVAPEPPLAADDPDRSFANGEFALRLFRTIAGREYALYAYHGFFKQPTALTPSLQATFAPMTSLGASLRRPVGPGVFNAELSYYLSRDDRSGNDPLLPNGQLRFLAGYEWEAKPNFAVAFQYYLESTLDHDELIDNSPNPQFEPDEHRHLLTNRLTYRAGRDKHTWSLFTFYSPSDSDFYLRPVYSYRHSDQWSVTAGANLFGGDNDHTFFKQLADASNAYLRIRYQY